VGKPEMVQKDWIKPGAVVVDVGINRVEDSSRERGWRLAGDVHPDVEEVASILSPVPGGVGPMTVAMLMANTVTSAEAQHS
ncbi:MAG: bifunctional methylenetetrahydrofolate dehydrogenase/methenyltetrahydrofolate cyclohydrolase, partial [Euryarchaeota archaeon]|nr:bifunctional methylenetetrahydrofolate dehydrogenase/methenyltetrahydrofolate cyclohydrolase [Euryarchaeota archaeon]